MVSHPRTIAVIDLGDFSHQRPDRYGHCPFGLRTLLDRPLFQWMASRLGQSELIDEVYVVGSNIPEYVLRSGITGFKTCQLPTAHLVERLAAAADDSECDWVAYVPATRPFVDPELIGELLKHTCVHAECDYVGYETLDHGKDQVSDLGLAGELFHVDTLRRLRCHVEHLPPYPTGSAAGWLRNAPGAYHLKFVPLPPELDRNDLRFCVDDEADWDGAQWLSGLVDQDDCPWRELARRVQDDDRLRESMSQRNDRQTDDQSTPA